MIDLTTTIIGIIGAPIVGSVTWLVKTVNGLDKKVALTELSQGALKELIVTKLDGLDHRLGRIETSLNGSLGHHEHRD